MAETESITCGHCGVGVAATIIHQAQPLINGQARSVQWLQCPSCHDASVKTASRAVYPVAPAGRTVQHLPEDVGRAWQEARTAHAVAAYTASEMMCRKILMHISVDKAGSSPGGSFLEYVNDLESAGFITAGLKPVVDQVRQRGNIANHELPSSEEQDSLLTLTITEHLLEGMYELPGMVTPAPASAPTQT